jgi:hypothetical protein
VNLLSIVHSLTSFRLHAGVPIARSNSVTISAAVIEDAINEFDQKHEQGTDEIQDDEASMDEVDADADGMGVQGLDWHDEVEEAGDEQVETDSE